MTVHFPFICNFSGADLYFQRLRDGLAARGVRTWAQSFPHILEFLPYRLVKPFLPPAGDCTVCHTKAEYGWMFAPPGCPLVVTLAHSVFDPAYDRYRNLRQRVYHAWKVKRNIARSFAVADRIVTVSHYSARSISASFGRSDVRVIYNGVDEHFFRPDPEPKPASRGPLRLLFVGNRTARKGFDLLPLIMSRLGEGFVLDYTSGLRSREGKPPHPSMCALGRLTLSELVGAYQRCDVLLFPSRLEGFGYPVAEAMACGKPVVCTDGSSLRELVDEGRGGYLCPQDDVECFAERIRLLAQDPRKRAEMGDYNRAKVEKQFSLARCVQQYLDLYEELR